MLDELKKSPEYSMINESDKNVLHFIEEYKLLNAACLNYDYGQIGKIRSASLFFSWTPAKLSS
jgi:hypothetical protein